MIVFRCTHVKWGQNSSMQTKVIALLVLFNQMAQVMEMIFLSPTEIQAGCWVGLHIVLVTVTRTGTTLLNWNTL